ncbi:hypothetical protein RR46_03642 [Papilio xuthus]|uniref:Uncharacterized protein n=1 Tax=Papilio xuthus TaxID=66420 RepID=A0A194Q502_PAPXU|nr:hypothetical protein RR46_03642 [Papilio xuthus]
MILDRNFVSKVVDPRSRTLNYGPRGGVLAGISKSREDEVPEKKKEIWKAPLKLVKQTLSKTKMADNPATSDTKHNSSTNIV